MTTNKTILLALLWVLLLSICGHADARFLSPDPKPADEQNFNRYWYANNNPYSFVDPDGREGVAIWRMDRAIDDMNAGRISVSEFRAQRDAAGAGALIGLGIVGAGYGGGALLANPLAANNAAVAVGELMAGDAVGGAAVGLTLAKVISASGGSLRAAIGEINRAGLVQADAVRVVEAVLQSTGREFGGIADAAGGAKVLTGIVAAAGQDVVHLASDGTATLGRGTVKFGFDDAGNPATFVTDLKLNKDGGR